MLASSPHPSLHYCDASGAERRSHNGYDQYFYGTGPISIKKSVLEHELLSVRSEKESLAAQVEHLRATKSALPRKSSICERQKEALYRASRAFASDPGTRLDLYFVETD